PIQPLVAAAGAALRTNSVVHVDTEEKQARLDDRETVDFDAFVLAVGTQARDAVVGALTFRGPQDSTALSALLERATAGKVQRIAFVVPAGVSWPLPMYELALQTASYLSDRGTRGVEVVVVTAEEHLLGVFGREASDALAELLELRGVEVEAGRAAMAWGGGVPALAGGGPVGAGAAGPGPPAARPRAARLSPDAGGGGSRARAG